MCGGAGGGCVEITVSSCMLVACYLNVSESCFLTAVRSSKEALVLG